jgi:16S rRNA (guanine1516-N2)-methyltransferase
MQVLAEHLAVIHADELDFVACEELAASLNVALYCLTKLPDPLQQQFFLCYREGCLKLLDQQSLKKGGLMVEIEPRPGEQHSYPAPKKDLLAVAVGKKSKTIVDATTGWAQDSLALFRMGYSLTCMERSPVMSALIQDGFQRLTKKD